MSLRDAFASKETLFSRALAESDTRLMEDLLSKGRSLDLSYLINLPRSPEIGKVTSEMARFLARKMDAAAEKRLDKYGLYRSQGFLHALFIGALHQSQNAELAPAFSEGPLPPQKIAMGVLQFIDDPQARLATFAQIADGDAARFNGPWEMASYMLSRDMRAEFDAFAAAGFDPHKDNEHLLRHAAHTEQRDFALHLVQNHGADIDLAINTARNTGEGKVQAFLEALRSETHPDAEPLISFEDMAKELTVLRKTVKTLEKTVAGLAEQVAALQNPAAKLDKTPLRKQQP